VQHVVEATARHSRYDTATRNVGLAHCRSHVTRRLSVVRQFQRPSFFPRPSSDVMREKLPRSSFEYRSLPRPTSHVEHDALGVGGFLVPR
jgi:hypothetical protein